ncbi:HpcH/HpaI aldolase/citrate lyase family protein [Ramlibacter sp.]|uniref:HpcH/HpaI aldolase/citrate lyase family protein n=1 Tax=Ramlibacter sp. TaxID=1917967 RepID=UPI003D0A8C74
MNIIRSWLIAPANRPRFLAKFPTVGADCSVVDLEDGTPEMHKREERERLSETIRGLREAGLNKGLHVRVNHPRSPHYLDDLKAAGAAGVDGVSIPKIGTVAELKAAVNALAAAEQKLGRQISIICGIESAMGALNVSELAFADPRVEALYFGSEDFVTDMLGARRTREGTEVLYARSRIVLAAKAARIGAIDQSVLEIRDDKLFEKDSLEGRNLGFDGKICLNPIQTALANRIFGPTPDEVEFSRRLIAAAHKAESEGIGTIDFEGRMIDGPLIKRCEHIIAMAAAQQRSTT